jgi:hypothetical protein
MGMSIVSVTRNLASYVCYSLQALTVRSDNVIMPERNQFCSLMPATKPLAVSGDSHQQSRGEVWQHVSLAVYGRQAREQRIVIGRVVWYLVIVGHRYELHAFWHVHAVRSLLY